MDGQVLRTKLTMGADFNTQLNIWQLRTIWEDQIIGGRLTVKVGGAGGAGGAGGVVEWWGGAHESCS